MYRIGNKQKRALLSKDGKELAIFSKGQEKLAKAVCELLNNEIEANEMMKRSKMYALITKMLRK